MSETQVLSSVRSSASVLMPSALNHTQGKISHLFWCETVNGLFLFQTHNMPHCKNYKLTPEQARSLLQLSLQITWHLLHFWRAKVIKVQLECFINRCGGVVHNRWRMKGWGLLCFTPTSPLIPVPPLHNSCVVTDHPQPALLESQKMKQGAENFYTDTNIQPVLLPHS